MSQTDLNRMKRIAIFCQVIDSGSMTAAAKALGITPPAISQYITQLEQELEVTLIFRSTRKISLSEAGEQYYKHGKRMLQSAKQADEAIEEIKHSLTGELKISAPVGLAAKPLASALNSLLSNNPNLKLIIEASDKKIDLVSEKVDIALRAGIASDTNFIYHNLGHIKKLVCVSPHYLKQHSSPQNPDELLQYQWLGLTNSAGFSNFTLHHTHQESWAIKPPLKIQANDLNVLISHTVEGLGLAVLPELEVRHLLKSGELVQVLPEWRLDSMPVYALTIDKVTSLKVRTALNAFKTYFSKT